MCLYLEYVNKWVETQPRCKICKKYPFNDIGVYSFTYDTQDLLSMPTGI